MQNFRALGAPPPVPRASGGWGLLLQTPKPAPPPPYREFLATRLPSFGNSGIQFFILFAVPNLSRQRN